MNAVDKTLRAAVQWRDMATGYTDREWAQIVALPDLMFTVEEAKERRNRLDGAHTLRSIAAVAPWQSDLTPRSEPGWGRTPQVLT